jgi:hypothetical protein
MSNGKIMVESKEDIAKRLEGRSTDAADGVGDAVFAQYYQPLMGGGNLR